MTDRTCPTIQAAKTAAGNDDEVVILPKSGGWSESVTFAQAGLTVRGGGPGETRINGSLSFTGGAAATYSIRRLVVIAPTNSPALSFSSGALDGTKTVQLESVILSGAGTGPAIAVSRTAGVSNSISVDARHVTIADEGSASALVKTDGGGAGMISASFHNSIVQGPTGGADVADNNDMAPDKATVFANPNAEDYHLRVGSPAIDHGGTRQGTEETADIDGEARGTPWDRGADEFVNHPPTKPTLAATKTDPQTGEAVGFVAQGATDPDGALKDSVILYRWDFGDGATAETTSAGAAHAFATAGTYAVRVQAVDQVGAAGPQSDPVTVTATAPPPTPGPEDGNTPVGPGGAGLPGIPADPTARPKALDTSPPLLAITTPRTGQRVRLGRVTPTLRGRTADESGVRRVELALLRLEGRRCLWYDGRASFRAAPCTTARWFRAVLDDFDWRYAFPRTVRPRVGSYVLAARAVDYRGHMTTAPTAVAFRYIR
jgi:hypothetical protein